MLEILNSFWLIFLSEMGDKTQLLAFVLAAKYKKPWPVMMGVMAASALNHGLAAFGGSMVAKLVQPDLLSAILALVFILFGLWLLKPDKLEKDEEKNSRFGPFITTAFVFFLAEMGDKTQIATVALGAKSSNFVLVTFGSTLGMMAANAIPVFYGEGVLKKLPMKWVRIFASAVFILTGIFVYFKGA